MGECSELKVFRFNVSRFEPLWFAGWLAPMLAVSVFVMLVYVGEHAAWWTALGCSTLLFAIALYAPVSPCEIVLDTVGMQVVVITRRWWKESAQVFSLYEMRNLALRIKSSESSSYVALQFRYGEESKEHSFSFDLTGRGFLSTPTYIPMPVARMFVSLRRANAKALYG